MSILNLLRIALRSLGKNKLRSFLTMLGIIIGVAAVISMLSIAQGAKDMIKAQISSLGTNIMIIFPQASNTGGVRDAAGTTQKLTEDDAKAIAQRCPSVQYVSPIVRVQSQLIASGQNWRTNVMGAYPEYMNIRDLSLQSGAFYTSTDERGATKVCVIGQTVADNLFGKGVNPVGQSIRIKNIPFDIIGLLTAKGQTSWGQDQDDVVLTPFNTAQKRMVQSTSVQQILVSARSADQISEASSEITDVLRDKHKITPYEQDDFTIRTQTDISSAADSSSQTLTVLLASIASISLLVGGIGIMNIMLVSVTERTREIGLRMAVGARGRDVLRQFLIESILLSLVGGAIGAGLGIGVSKMISSTQGWPITIAPQSILLSFSFALLIGVFFGWYPARKASHLNPIDALRFE